MVFSFDLLLCKTRTKTRSKKKKKKEEKTACYAGYRKMYEFQIGERSIFVIGPKPFSFTTQVCCGRWDGRGAAVCLWWNRPDFTEAVFSTVAPPSRYGHAHWGAFVPASLARWNQSSSGTTQTELNFAFLRRGKVSKSKTVKYDRHVMYLFFHKFIYLICHHI